MRCEDLRDQFVVMITGGWEPLPSDPVPKHLEGCEACRQELELLRATWALLGRWPELAPGQTVGARLTRRIRWAMLREALMTVQGWTPAVLSAAVGVGLSLALSLVVHYSDLVQVCREALGASNVSAAPYLVAGVIYGLPVALGAVAIMRQFRTAMVVRGVETSLLFLAIIAPYVIAECREFPRPLLLTFLSGMGLGALLPTLGGLWVVNRVRVS